MHRRAFVAAVGAVSTVAVAGCSDGGPTQNETGDGGESGTTATDSPGAVIEAVYLRLDELAAEATLEDRFDALEPYRHPHSPYPEIIRGGERAGQSSEYDNSIQSIETDVLARDLDPEGLVERFPLLLTSSREGVLTEDELEILAEKNAVVEVDVEDEVPPSEQSEHLAATDGGEWLYVVYTGRQNS